MTLERRIQWVAGRLVANCATYNIVWWQADSLDYVKESRVLGINPSVRDEYIKPSMFWILKRKKMQNIFSFFFLKLLYRSTLCSWGTEQNTVQHSVYPYGSACTQQSSTSFHIYALVASWSYASKGRMQLCSAAYVPCVLGSRGNKACSLSVTLVRVAVSTPAISSLCTSRSTKETPPPSRTLYHQEWVLFFVGDDFLKMPAFSCD